MAPPSPPGAGERVSERRHSSWIPIGLTLASVLVMGLNAVAGVSIARALSASAYGEFSYLMGLYLLATLLGGFGLTDQAMRDIGGFRATGERDQARQAFYALLAARIGSGAGLIAALAVYGLAMGQPLPALVGVAGALSMTADFMVGVLRGFNRLGSVIAMLCVQPIAYLALLAAGGGGRVEDILGLFCISQGLSLLAGVGLVLLAAPGWPRRPLIDLSRVRRSGAGALQLYLVSLCSMIFNTLGSLVLGAFRHYDAAGLLSASLTLTQMAPLILGASIVSVFYPQLSALVATGAAAEAAATFRAFCGPLALLALGAAVGLAVFPASALQALYTDTYLAASGAVLLMAPVSCLMLIELLCTWTLIAHHAERRAILALLFRTGLLGAGLLLAALGPPGRALATASLSYLVSSAVGCGLLCWQAAGLG
ncbi:MAG TPA: oligosaccharide flippase family protein, partial [Herpetosiphonaceae bacterium]